jgi:ArsR family transcriptional regulator, arsenate/arsenite/antimonite-responsive transcriptional repressor
MNRLLSPRWAPSPIANACGCSGRWWSRAPSALAESLGVARNALSFHLKALAHANLVSIEPQGRNLRYRADFAQMNALLGYLTEHCCEGGTCEVSAGACGTAC